MKRYIAICVLAMVCGLPARAQYIGTIRLDNSSARVEGDSVRVSFKMHVDREGTDWFSGMLLTPALSNGDPTLPTTKITALPNIMLQGKNKNKASQRAIRLLGEQGRAKFRYPVTTIRVNKETDTLLDYSYAVAYEPWMASAKLSLYEEVIDFRNRRQLIVLAAGDVDIPAPVPAPVPEPIHDTVVIVPPAPEIHTLSGEAFLDFPVGSIRIQPDFRRNPDELYKLRKMLHTVQNDPTATIIGLKIEGFASIEGNYDTNERLSKARALALKNYILQNFFLPIKPSQIEVSWTAEDWDGLAKLVEKSDIIDKETILAIIRNVGIFDGREKKLMDLNEGYSYKTMLREMFPKLRRVQYEIEYTVKGEK